MNTQKSSLYIGIDVGGSKTKAYSSISSEESVKEWQAAGANPSRLAYAECLEILSSLFIEILCDNPVPLKKLVVEMGVAGIRGEQNSATLTKDLQKLLTDKIPESELFLNCVSDIEMTARMDLGEKGGISIILGTGSSYIVIDKQEEIFQGGGWGYLLGDEASGFAISIAAVQHCLLCIDGNVRDDFTEGLLQEIQAKDRSQLIDYVYSNKDGIQHLAKWIVQESSKGSTTAKRILETEISSLLDHLHIFCQKLELNLEPRIVLNGGLTQNPEIQRRFISTMRDSSFSSFDISVSKIDPAKGALKLAQLNT